MFLAEALVMKHLLLFMQLSDRAVLTDSCLSVSVIVIVMFAIVSSSCQNCLITFKSVSPLTDVKIAINDLCSVHVAMLHNLHCFARL